MHSHRRRLHEGDGGDRPHGQKTCGGDAPKSPAREFYYVIFETVKCTFKIRIYHYASDKSYAEPQPKLKCTESAPPDLGGFKSGGSDKGRRKGETTGGDRQPREGTGMTE